MRANTILAVAKMLGLNSKGPDGAGWVTLECPFAPVKHTSGADRNPSMRVEVAPGRYSRWRCFSCGEGGHFSEVLLTLRQLGAQLPWGELLAIAAAEEDDLGITPFAVDEQQAPPVLDDTWLNQFKQVHVSAAGSGYCAGRGMSLAEQMAWGLRYDVERRRVIFPIRDFNGYLRGAQGRTILPDTKPKYLFYEVAPDYVSGHQFWFNEQAVDFDKPVIMVEGPTDAIAVARVYPNVVAAMGSAVLRPDKLDRMASCSHVITFFDQGDAGDTARDNLRKWCYKKRSYRQILPLSAKLDPGNMTPDQIKFALIDVLDEDNFLL